MSQPVQQNANPESTSIVLLVACSADGGARVLVARGAKQESRP